MGRWDKELIPPLLLRMKVYASVSAGFDWVDVDLMAERGKFLVFHERSLAPKTRVKSAPVSFARRVSPIISRLHCPHPRIIVRSGDPSLVATFRVVLTSFAFPQQSKWLLHHLYEQEQVEYFAISTDMNGIEEWIVLP